MSDAGIGHLHANGIAPVRTRNARPVLTVVLALVLAVAVGIAAWTFRVPAPLWVTATAAVLALGGLFLMFGLAAGAIQIGGGTPERVFLDGLADAMGEACVVTDLRGRAVYANGDYLKLVSADGTGPARRHREPLCGLSRRLGPHLPPGAGGARRTARDRRVPPHCRLRGCSAPNRTSPRGSAISVAPIETEGSNSYALWRHQDISADRARQERAFAHLQYHHQLSRPGAGRLLLGRCRRQDRLCQCHAGGVAGPRPRCDDGGNSHAQGYRLGCRREACYTGIAPQAEAP